MRIAIDGMLLSRQDSGVELSIRNLAKALYEFGREEYVFYVPRRYAGGEMRSPRFATRRSRLPAHWRSVRILWEQVVLPYLVRQGRADVVHAPGYVAPVLVRAPVVITVYDLIAFLYPELCTAANRMHYRLLLPLSARRAAGIIVPSECTQRDLVSRLGIDAEKMRVIPLAISEEFRVLEGGDEEERVRARYALPERFMLFVGKQEPKKNLVRLVEAFARLKRSGRIPHGLVIAGQPGWRCAELHRRVRELGLGADVLFTGFVPADALVQLYNLAELFVFPSLYEGFGLPPLEAMACGAPVVCSDRGSIPEVVGDAALSVDPLDIDALAGAMQDGLTNAPLRDRLRAKGLERVSRFSWQRVASATERFYGELGNP